MYSCLVGGAVENVRMPVAAVAGGDATGGLGETAAAAARAWTIYSMNLSDHNVPGTQCSSRHRRGLNTMYSMNLRDPNVLNAAAATAGAWTQCTLWTYVITDHNVLNAAAATARAWTQCTPWTYVITMYSMTLLLLVPEQCNPWTYVITMYSTLAVCVAVFRIRIHGSSGSGFRGLLDPDSESGTRGLKRVKNVK